MNSIKDAPEDVEREVNELAGLLMLQAERVSELARLLVDRIEERIRCHEEE